MAANPWRSLNAIAVFEAAGRLSSFTRAGEELGISQESVSYAVRKLEDELGRPLFLRGHRKVTLTAAGSTLFNDVSISLSHISKSLGSVRARRADDHVTLSVSTAFASYWLLPRLADFRAAFPSIDLRLQSTDRDVDIAAEGIALGIRYGGGVLGHYRTAAFAPEIIYPVCSRRFAETEGQPLPWTSADLAHKTLIHLEEPYRPCPTWADYLRAVGLAPPRTRNGLCLNDYALVVQAALEGQGVVLGWHHLLDRLVEADLLMRPVAEAWDTGTSFSVVWSAPLSPEAETVRDWLLAEGAKAAGVG